MPDPALLLPLSFPVLLIPPPCLPPGIVGTPVDSDEYADAAIVKRSLHAL